jgi:hypothetical protein
MHPLPTEVLLTFCGTHGPLQMLIKGIRSFAPENHAAIEFYKPLTLIVGSNGAGKTVSRAQQLLHAVSRLSLAAAACGTHCRNYCPLDGILPGVTSTTSGNGSKKQQQE